MKRDDRTLLLRSQSGFSLVELLVYMAILGVLLALVMTSFTQTLQLSAQQSGIAETQIETGVGLDLLRSDLEHAGFGLPWGPLPPEFPNYTEWPYLEDASSGSVPRALNSANISPNSLNEADYLVIRAANVTRGLSGQKWGRLGSDSTGTVGVQSAGTGDEAFDANDWVIALRPRATDTEPERSLVMDGGGRYKFRARIADLKGIAPEPSVTGNDGEQLLLYGIDDDEFRRPFNRTDYFISAYTAANPATHCAGKTGFLARATLSQDDDSVPVPQPVVDCVADFQVVYFLDDDEDGAWDRVGDANELNGMDAAAVRNRVREVRCFILLHEGAEDRSYTYPNQMINVGEVRVNNVVQLPGRAFDLAKIDQWAHYRWKVVSLSVTPKNLR